MNEENNEIDDLTKINQEAGSEFDLRQYERQMFADLYSNFLQHYTEYRMYRDEHETGLKFLSVSKTLINTFKRYAKHDSEVFERCEDMEEKINPKEKRLKNTMTKRNHNTTLSNKYIDQLKEVVEDLRHTANLKMPEKTKTDPESAWKE